jgi:tRNA dimethylallyltransferase
MERRAVVILGPTCSGKSFVAFETAKLLQSEIISADSRQFYKYLDIGTAKPPDAYMREIPHHLISFLEPDDSYNVSNFEQDALSIMRRISYPGNIPVISGGSGLYIQAIVDGIFEISADAATRDSLMGELEQHGIEYMYKKLASLDPASAATMLPQNWKRVIRALEVFITTGRSITVLQQEHRRKPEFTFFQFCIEWTRALLYERINARVDEMLAAGLVDEVKELLERGISPHWNAMNTVGYKEIVACLNGEIVIEEAIRRIKRNTRHFAKRQFTWFKRDSRIINLHVDSEQALRELPNTILSFVLNNSECSENA